MNPNPRAAPAGLSSELSGSSGRVAPATATAVATTKAETISTGVGERRPSPARETPATAVALDRPAESPPPPACFVLRPGRQRLGGHHAVDGPVHHMLEHHALVGLERRGARTPALRLRREPDQGGVADLVDGQQVAGGQVDQRGGHRPVAQAPLVGEQVDHRGWLRPAEVEGGRLGVGLPDLGE
ncbi:MAG: hypothetical protein M3179_01095 [Actinomycetota bacterium]|nr:hypothetical protein [Actinomycetota bacterium]